MSEALNPAASVSVSASAGSGKTWLLTARIARLLLEGHSPDGILALTFTRKAATEMRQRVQARLRTMALADAAALDAQLRELGLTPDAALRTRARGLYQQLLFHPWPLRATTLHAFCQDLVARFPRETGVAPGFEVSDSDAALIDAAWAGLQRRLLTQTDGPLAAALDTLSAEGWREGRLRQVIVQFLEHRADWHAYTDGQPEALAFAEQRLREQLALQDEPLAALQTPGVVALLQSFAALMARAQKVGRLDADAVLPALMHRSEDQFQRLCEQLLTKDGQPRAFKPSAAVRKLLGADGAQLEDDYAALTALLLRLREQQARHATWRRTTAALTLGCAALAELEQACRVHNRVGFTDLEWRAYRLLADPEAGAWVQFKLDQRIDHLLLDEFQDTSPTQWHLLLPLLQEMAAGNDERARSAFIVGDPKQSIYGFRRANPDLLPRATAWMQEHLGAATDTLSLSRRSSPGVIRWINALFLPELMPGFPPHDTARQGWGRVELAPLIAPDDDADDSDEAFRNPLQQPRPDPENTRALREGRQIAARIQALVDARWAVARDHGETALGYGDILILTRKRTHLQALERALTEADIPFTGAARNTLPDTAEARDLAALLRFLLSPGRDLELAQVLRSPIIGADDADLLHLAGVAREQRCSGFQALQRAAQGATLTRALRLLQQWLPLARRLPVHDLLDRICSEGNLANRYEAALPPAQSARVRGNLNAFVQLALEADSGRYPSLSRFLETLRRYRGSREAPDEAAPEGAERQVRILTVHAAKGLEAPAVFLAQAGGARQAHAAGWLVEWPSDAERPTHFLLGGNKEQRDPLSNELLLRRQLREGAEEMNLLYVAVTRARQFLHISGFGSKRNSHEPSWHALAQAAFEQLGAVADDSGLLQYTEGTPTATANSDAAPPTFADDPRLRQRLDLPLATSARPSGDGVEHDAAAIRRGTAVHWLLQQLSEGRDDGLRGPLEAQLGGAARDDEFQQWLAEAQAVLAAPALRHLFDRATLQRAWNEVSISDGDTLGVIDRLVDDGETLWVLDYKTARDTGDATLLQRYRDQLLSYRRAVTRLWPGRRLRTGLVLTQPPRWLELV